MQTGLFRDTMSTAPHPQCTRHHNIVLTLTGAEAQYQFITTLISAGDVNGDGIIDDNDYRMFDELSKLFEGLYS